MFSGRFFLLLLFILVSISQSFAQSKTFLQEIKLDIPLPDEAENNVLKLFRLGKEVAVVTETGVFRYQNGKWIGKKKGEAWVSATQTNTGEIWLASAQSIYAEKTGKRLAQLPISQNDTILCLFWESSKRLLVGTTTGLLIWDGIWHRLPWIKETRITSIAKDAFNQIYVATNKGLWRREGDKWANLDETLMAVGNEEKYYSLTGINGGKDIVIGTLWSVACIAGDGNHWVLRGVDGLPYGPVTVIRSDNGLLWMGTQKGAIRKDKVWRYYHGKRWLPDNQVNDILIFDSLKVWIATPKGIVQIQKKPMTLEQKADSIEKAIAARHNRRGLINLSKLSTPGVLSSNYMENEDNDGLWSACYLAAECFRYGATKDSQAKANAIRTFEALERLETITGISGYPARSYAMATDQVAQSQSPHRKEWHLSPDGKWQWLDDTSSDEITGHMFALPVFFELVADSAQKERVRQLIKRIVTHIVDNQYRLIDFDGKPTRWGIWHPDSLNRSPDWMYERGLNSLEILAFLKTAYFFTADPKFEKQYQYLVKQHGYAQNALQAKVFGPFETSHSDDILNFFPYYTLLRYTQNDPNHEIYVKSLVRSWNAVRNDRMPVWNVFASALLNKDCDLKVAQEEIQQYPIDLINWTMENSHRWDIPKDQLVSRFKNTQATYPIPTPESGISRWNTNPKEFDVGDGGQTEESGTYFLFAYWMGRYYGYWE